MSMKIHRVEDMVGKTFVSIEKTNDELKFNLDDGSFFKFYHENE
jgi:hypothetical protein